MPKHQLHRLREILENNSKMSTIFKLNVMSDEMLENFYSSILRCSSQSSHRKMEKFEEISSDCTDEIILSSWEFVKNMIKTKDENLCAKNKIVVTSPLKAFVQDFIILQMCQN